MGFALLKGIIENLHLYWRIESFVRTKYLYAHFRFEIMPEDVDF